MWTHDWVLIGPGLIKTETNIPDQARLLKAYKSMLAAPGKKRETGLKIKID